jgi:hypothetical protein
MRASSRLEGNGTVGVAWEVYGLGFRSELLTFRLRLIPEGGSIIRRALKRIGLFQREPLLTLSWTEEGPEHPGPFFKAVELDLPTVEPGRYVLQLELDLPRRSEVLSQRRVTIR